MTNADAAETAALRGRRIIVTRSEGQASALVERLRALGADVVACPTIAIRPPEQIAPLDAAIRNLTGFDWVVFTSANAVDSVAERLVQSGKTPGTLGIVRVAAVGAATRRALLRHGVAVSCVPEPFTSTALVEAMGDVRDLHVLLPRSDLADATLPIALRTRGARLYEVIAYRTVPADDIASLGERMAREVMDAIVFTSPSTARYFLDGLRSASALDRVLDRTLAGGTRPAIICIGPTTAGAVRELVGALAVDAVAETHDDDGLVDAIVRWSRAHPRAASA
ncbi:MAG: uroporphyrinogen-III synthase [Gemmatimonadaceae bacterium]